MGGATKVHGLMGVVALAMGYKRWKGAENRTPSGPTPYECYCFDKWKCQGKWSFSGTCKIHVLNLILSVQHFSTACMHSHNISNLWIAPCVTIVGP